MAAHLIELGAAGQELVALSELPDDLVGTMPTSGHGAVLLAPVWGNGLPRRPDHHAEVTAQRSGHRVIDRSTT